MTVACPHCAKQLTVPEERAGEVGLCPHCRGQLRIPKPPPAEPAPPAPKAPAQSPPVLKRPPFRTKRFALIAAWVLIALFVAYRSLIGTFETYYSQTEQFIGTTHINSRWFFGQSVDVYMKDKKS